MNNEGKESTERSLLIVKYKEGIPKEEQDRQIIEAIKSSFAQQNYVITCININEGQINIKAAKE
jgi:hypothetical protein